MWTGRALEIDLEDKCLGTAAFVIAGFAIVDLAVGHGMPEGVNHLDSGRSRGL